ncbi:hypothetical protein HDU96_001697 [Phlyctochytrium bullatum]|nr:hypothetical protein HDU96_001697 [Phlyctochytrium bullatum]
MDPATIAAAAKYTALTALGLFSGASVFISIVEHPAMLKDPAVGVRQFQVTFPSTPPPNPSPFPAQKTIIPASKLQGGTAIIAAAAGATAAVASGQAIWFVPTAFGVGVWAWTAAYIFPINGKLLRADTADGVDREALRRVGAEKLLKDWGELHWVRTAAGVGAFALVASF